jgi:hypothetical protein
LAPHPIGRQGADFRRLWARHDVSGLPREAKRLHHREVGDLTLTCEVFNVNSSPGQQLLILQAEPASPSEHALRRATSSGDVERQATGEDAEYASDRSK